MNNKIIFSFFMIYSFCLYGVKDCEQNALILKNHCSSDLNDRLREILEADKPWQEKRCEVAAIISEGADPNVREYTGYRGEIPSDHGNSALTYAVCNDDCTLAAYLLRKGAKIKDDFLWSYNPLFFEAKSEKMIKLLVDSGRQDIAGKAKQSGDTVLHHLARSSENGSSLLFRYYLTSGLNPNEKNNTQQTVLDILMQHEFDDETTEKIMWLRERISNFSSGNGTNKEWGEIIDSRLRCLKKDVEKYIKIAHNTILISKFIKIN